MSDSQTKSEKNEKNIQFRYFKIKVHGRNEKTGNNQDLHNQCRIQNKLHIHVKTDGKKTKTKKC